MPELVVSWVVIGIIAGLLVYLFSNKRLQGGLFGNLAVGILGAVAGGWLISYATSVDVADAALTWGILIVSLLSAAVVAIAFQSQAPVRAKK